MSSIKTNVRKARYVSACLLMVWALAMGIAPARAAVPVAPASQIATMIYADQPAAQPEAGKEEGKKSGEIDENIYRHSAVVRWFAGLMHTDDETAAKLFEWINFAVIILAVGIPLVKVLPGVLKQRTAKLGAALEVAQAKTADAGTRLSAVEARMAGLDTEIAEIRKQVEAAIVEDEARARAAIEEEKTRIVQAAEQEIQVAATQAQRELKQFAADLAIDRALRSLTIDDATDRSLIAEFGEDLAASGKGGHK